MKTILFQERFVGEILSGAKWSTLRPGSPRFTVGESASFRHWTGKPYRSPQFEFGLSFITSVTPNVYVADEMLSVDFREIDGHNLRHFAFSEGFKDPEEMFSWFSEHYPGGFLGTRYTWKPFGL